MSEQVNRQVPTNLPGEAKQEESVKELRDIDYFKDISGTTINGRTKAHVTLRWYEKNSDGSETPIREVSSQKAVVHIIKRPGYINLYLDFGRRIDVDLHNTFNVIQEFFNPLNSVSYTEEEYENGIFNDGTQDRLVYFPMLSVYLSPVGKETEYIIIGANPACAHLTCRDVSGEPCVIVMTFEEGWFIVDTPDQIDMNELQREVMESMHSGEALNFMK